MLAQWPDHQRDMCGADVGGFGDHVRDRQKRAIVVVVELLDLELAPLQRGIGINHAVGVHQPQFQRLRHCKDLEGRAKLVHPLNRAVEKRAVTGFGILVDDGVWPVVGVEGRQGSQGQDLAGAHVHQDRGGPLGVQHLHAGAQHLFDRGLQGQVDRQRQGGASLCGVTQPQIQRLLDTRRADHFRGMDTFRPEGRPAQHMRGQRAVGVKPHLARTEQKARVADFMHQLHLFG